MTEAGPRLRSPLSPSAALRPALPRARLTAIPPRVPANARPCSRSEAADGCTRAAPVRRLLFAGDDAGGEGQPVGGWAARRGAAWGRQCVGNKLEILRADSAARHCRKDDHAAIEARRARGGPARWSASTRTRASTRWRSTTTGARLRCSCSRRRCVGCWTKFSPVAGVPEVPPAPRAASPSRCPRPVACGGMRGCLLPGGKRGEELVRYAAPRSPSTPGVMAEFTVPADGV